MAESKQKSPTSKELEKKIKTLNGIIKTISPKLHAEPIPPRYFKELDTGYTYLIIVDNDALDYASEHNILPDYFFATFHHRVRDTYYFNIQDDTNTNLIRVKLNDPKNSVMIVSREILLPIAILNSFLGFEPNNRHYRIHPDEPSSVRSSVGLNKSKRNNDGSKRNNDGTSNSSDKRIKISSSAGGKTNTRKRNNKYKSKRIN
jgi:hypothetical protein